ncbi:diphthamide biosynthesis enzyme Dph2 [Methanosarcinales archaeon]|nr:MAG: diphthamide biosynthesis enzyme Dph2 [Methanosarcinales archaeon]
MQQKTEFRIDIEGIINIIRERGVRSVGLQLPAGLMRQGRLISKEVQNQCNIPVIIAGKGCYGSCDIDTELLGMVDILFHFGHSGSDRENLIFVEVQSTLDVSPAIESAIEYLEGDKIAVVTTIQHIDQLDRAKTILERAKKEVMIRMGSGDGINYPGQVLGCNASAVDPRCDEVLFIGTGLFHPGGIALICKKKVVAVDPYTERVEVIDPESLIRRRWAILAGAIDADVFGVILSAKSGQYNKELADKILKAAADHKIEAHLILLDEITEDALINLGMDVYINTACPRLVDDMEQVTLLNPDEFKKLLDLRER